MNIKILKNFVANSANRLKKFDEDSPLEHYELGQLSAYENILFMIETLENDDIHPSNPIEK